MSARAVDVHACAACRQRPAWTPRRLCAPCCLLLRSDLRGIVEDYRWLGECMACLPPSWRTSAIRAHRVEAPIPFDPQLAAQREDVARVLASWAVNVVDVARPRRWPPHDVTPEITAPWLTRQLGWILRHESAGDMATEIRGLRTDTERAAPRELDWLSLPLPCPRCGRLALSERAATVRCQRGGCGHAMTPGAYRDLENQIAAKLAAKDKASAA
jgi:hypothetical protein